MEGLDLTRHKFRIERVNERGRNERERERDDEGRQRLVHCWIKLVNVKFNCVKLH